MIDATAQFEQGFGAEEESDDEYEYFPQNSRNNRNPRRISTDSNYRYISSSPKGTIALSSIKKSQSSFITPLNLILDLDNTLIYTSVEANSSYDFTVTIPDDSGSMVTLYITKRPHLDAFLAKISNITQPYIFTSSSEEYADQIISFLDPLGKIFVHKFFRDSCRLVKPNVYVKDISTVGTCVERTILVDDNIEAFGGHLENAVRIPPFLGDPHDRELDTLSSIVERLRTFDDVRPLLMKINSR